MRKFVTLKQILYETNEYLTSLVYNWSTFAENQIQMSTNQFKHSTMEKLRKLILSFFALLASTVPILMETSLLRLTRVLFLSFRTSVIRHRRCLHSKV